MVANAEKFLIRSLSPSSKSTHFDDLRYNVYHDKKFQFDLEKFPSTSESMKLHIQRAYFQAYLWKRASFADQISLIPEEYGNVEDEIGQLRPLIVSASNFQMIFLCHAAVSCSCARENVWQRRLK